MFTILVSTFIQGLGQRPKTPPPPLMEKFGLFNTAEDANETLRLAGWDQCQTGWLKSNPKDPEGKDPLAPFWTAEVINLHKTLPIEKLPGYV